MSRDEQIRLMYTYLRHNVELAQLKTGTLMNVTDDMWGDIGCGAYTTERTSNLMKIAKELEQLLPAIKEYTNGIDSQIRQLHGEEQIRMGIKK